MPTFTPLAVAVVAAGLIDATELQESLRSMGLIFTEADTYTMLSELGARTNPGTGRASQADVLSGLYAKMSTTLGTTASAVMEREERADSLVATKLLQKLMEAVDERGG
jgi:hypothetical protein